MILPGLLLASGGGVVGSALQSPDRPAEASSHPRPEAVAAVTARLPDSPGGPTSSVLLDVPSGPAAAVLLEAPIEPAAAVPAVAAPPDRASRSGREALYVRPVDGPMTSPFGFRWGRLHAGIDFGVPVGTPVHVMMDGVVESAEFDAGGYGNVLKVRHADGTLSVYGHLSVRGVESGPVVAGDVIGLSGNTGHSTGPHLHFELRSAAGPFDPRPWLAERGLQL